MFLVDPKVFRFVAKGVKAIFLGVQRGWGLPGADPGFVVRGERE